MKPIGKYIRTVAKQLFGNDAEFRMDNHMFNVACALIIFILLVFLAIDAFFGYWHQCIVIFFVLVCECVFYWYSRFQKKFRLSIILNGIISYIALALNYLMDAGIDGPTILIFFFTLHTLISCTPPKLHPWWLALHTLTVCCLLGAEYKWPQIVTHNYTGGAERLIDILACYILTILLMYVVTRHMHNFYVNEKYVTENLQARLKAFFDSSSSSHLLLNNNKDLLYFNRAANQFAKAMHGTGMKEGAKISAYLHPMYAQRFNASFQTALAGNTATEEVNFGDKGDGMPVWWQISCMPARDGNGNIVGVSLNAVDISSRKVKEEKIRRKNESLAKISHIQSKGLRGPVASIIGLMNLVKDDGGRTAEYLAYMKEAANDLDKKIREIVDQTRVASETE